MPAKMAQDLIVGMASGYGWEELKPFVESLRATGTKARAILICGQHIPGVETVKPDETREHPFRSRHTQLVRLMKDEYRFVLSVDTKDIIFQSDPFEWLEQNLEGKHLVVATEGITFRQCKGFDERLKEFFPNTHGMIRDMEIMNAGVIAGHPWAVRELTLQTHALCESITGDDDEVPMNVVLRRNAHGVRFATARDGWVCNWNQKQSEVRDGVIYPTGSLSPYVLWHQWQYWRANVL